MSWRIKSETITFDTNDIVQGDLLVNLNASKSASYSGSGTIWYDLGPEGRDGTILGSPTWDGISFDITSDSTYISLDSYSHRTNNFTYSMWVKFDALDSSDALFENGAWSDTGPLFRLDSGTGPTVYAEGGNRGNFGWSPSTGIWYNIVYRRSGSTNSLFVNGVLTGSEFTNQTDFNIANANMYLMRAQYSSNQFTNGKIGQFAVYARDLSNDEIVSNYNVLASTFV